MHLMHMLRFVHPLTMMQFQMNMMQDWLCDEAY